MKNKKMVKPREELRQYEHQNITVIGSYVTYQNGRHLFKHTYILETGEKIDHLNLKVRKHLKPKQVYKITGTIERYVSPTKTTGYDFNFSDETIVVEPLK